MGFQLASLVRENVKGLKPYSSARDEYVSDGSEMVFLDANENPFDNGVNRYPDPQQRSLKDVLAKQKGVLADNILLGNGSDEVLDLLFRAFCEPKTDAIITLPPTYGMYKVLAATNDVTNREVLLNDSFEPDVAAILREADSNTKLLFLCSPNNPTGNRFSETAIQALLEGFNGLVVIDEAYIDFSSGESWVGKLEQFPNLVVTQTLSKAYGLAGIRLGICIASTEVISVLNKIKPPYNVNELTQKRALERTLGIAEVRQEVAMILKERERLIMALKNHPVTTEVFDTDANFVLARVDNAPQRYRQLLEQGVVVRNRSNQPLCNNTLRFTVGTAKENDRLLTALNNLT